MKSAFWKRSDLVWNSFGNILGKIHDWLFDLCKDNAMQWDEHIQEFIHSHHILMNPHAIISPWYPRNIPAIYISKSIETNHCNDHPMIEKFLQTVPQGPWHHLSWVPFPTAGSPSRFPFWGIDCLPVRRAAPGIEPVTNKIGVITLTARPYRPPDHPMIKG